MRRTRLLDVLDSVEARTILLVAPAGYGKTTLARQWLEHVGGRAWVSITPASVDVPVLARDLATAIGSITEIDSRRIETALSAGRTPTEQASAIARTIQGQVLGPVEGWIILDDYHLLEARSAAEELLSRVERSGNLRFLVTSRVRPSWATSRRKVYMETFELGTSDLALDEVEVSQLLPPDRRTSALRKQAHGWPAVIGLASHLQLSEVPVSRDSLSATLYDYFAEELFERLTLEVQRALTSLAVLPQLGRDQLSGLVGVAAGDLVATGLAYDVNGTIGVHPLARTYLLSKLCERSDFASVQEKAFDLAMSGGFYDHAFALVSDLAMNGRLEELITESYVTLIETGRIATVVRFGSYAEKHGDVPQPIIDLIGAETNLVAGRLTEARVRAVSAAEGLADHHPLKARAYLVAGRAALLDCRHAESLGLYAALKQHAQTVSETNEAAWGIVAASLVVEDMGLESAFKELESLPGKRLNDRLRLEGARLNLARIQGNQPDPLEGSRLAAQTVDPWVRSAWSNIHGYTLMLGARYGEANAIARVALADLSGFGLSFATRHLEWLLAASELGLRHFSRCDALLRRVQRHSDSSRDLYWQLNVRALQARAHLAQQRPQDALAVTAADYRNPPGRAMYGEYLATRALALAVLGEVQSAEDVANEAAAVSRSAETRIFAAAVLALLSLPDAERAEGVITALLDSASEAGIWDSLVCVTRAAPQILTHIEPLVQHRQELNEALLRSNDFTLARSLGDPTRPIRAAGVLSPREREVMEQLKQGKKNAEIAASLFITVGTVKRHLDHIYDKLGMRGRAGAISRYAEIEIGEGAGVDASYPPTGLEA